MKSELPNRERGHAMQITQALLFAVATSGPSLIVADAPSPYEVINTEAPRSETTVFCIKAFSDTDLTEDLENIDVFTRIIHGDDPIVPIGAFALLSIRPVKSTALKVHKGAPHRLCATHKDQVNEELVAFSRQRADTPVQSTKAARYY
jgi:pimeloyl-ACP methyl ester carboxylesterase